MERDLILLFDAFAFDSATGRLTEHGLEVRLGETAAAVLGVLLERAGQTVPAAVLLDAVPALSTEAVLRATISSLRRVLGERGGAARYIATVHGRGYGFVAPVQRRAAAPAAVAAPAPVALPGELDQLVGREDGVAAVAASLRAGRFVSVVGAGGLGKTALALAVARRMAGEFPAGLRLVDLTMVASAEALGPFVAATLDLPADAAAPARLAEALAGRRMLLILDNCEHLVDAAAELAEALYRFTPVTLLATSREALRAAGEIVHRLDPLAVPGPEVAGIDEALDHGAVRLFVSRARAAAPGFAPGDADVPALAEICRRLDGSPLALELVSGWVESLGLRQLAARLDDHFLLFSQGRPGAPSRQQTLQATFDWSYNALTPLQRRVFEAISVFRGAFGRGEAGTVAADAETSDAEVARALADLVAKSLVAVEYRHACPFFRLQVTTRAYARLKLAGSAAEAAVRARHAAYCLEMMGYAAGELAGTSRQDWLARHGELVADAIDAMEWCFGPGGDAYLGIRLAGACAPVASAVVGYAEIVDRAEAALQRLAREGEAGKPEFLEHAVGLGLLLHHRSGFSRVSIPPVRSNDSAGDPGLKAIIATWANAFTDGNYPLCRQSADRFEAVARAQGERQMIYVSYRIGSQAAHFLGDHDRARRLATEVLDGVPGENLPLTAVSHKVSMRIVLARIAALSGRRDEALAILDESRAEALRDSHVALCQHYSLASVPVAIWLGEIERAEADLADLTRDAGETGLTFWGDWAGEIGTALRTVLAGGPRIGPGQLPPATRNVKLADLLPTIDPAFLGETAIRRAEAGLVGWNLPEILRARALLPGADSAALLDRAERLAREQAAGLWLDRVAATRAALALAAAPPAGAGVMADGADIAATAPGERLFGFGPYRLNASRQVLYRDGAEVRLGSRAALMLTALVERAGKLVPKAELMRLVWPDTHVEEANLRVHIAALRMALRDSAGRDGYIASEPGRGYRFVSPVSALHGPAPAPAAAAADEQGPAPLPNLPGEVIGRAAEIETILGVASVNRLVTVVGAGGIGKTTVALAVAGRLAAERGATAAFVDLAVVTDPLAVPYAVAAALRVPVENARPVESLAQRIAGRPMVLLLDNCEHVVAAVSAIAEQVMRAAPDIRLIATSHEALGAASEWVCRLGPLPFPPPGTALSLAEAMDYPAIRFLASRASAGRELLAFSDREVPALVEICARLDGLPLALELAAASLDIYGVAELARQLDDRFLLLVDGRRTAATRHRTMLNVLEWSFGNLSPDEQAVLRRLSVHAGSFDLDAALAVASDGALDGFALTQVFSRLIRKSLVLARPGTEPVMYRLLESTRLHAYSRLDEAGEAAATRRRQVRHMIGELDRAWTSWPATPRPDWIARHGHLMDDIRAVLDWSLSGGDVADGVVLASLAMPLGLQYGLVDEFLALALRAVALAERLETPEPLAEMRLHLTLAVLEANTGADRVRARCQLARAAAVRAGEERLLEPEVVTAGCMLHIGSPADSLIAAERARSLSMSAGDDLAQAAAGRVLAQAAHFGGWHGQATLHARRVLAHPSVNLPFAYGNLQTDRRVSMRIVLARAAWMQGRPDEAAAVADEALALAAGDLPQSLSQALALAACPVALWRGDAARAGELVQRLRSHSGAFGLRHWAAWAEGYAAVLAGQEPDGPAPAGPLCGRTLATIDGWLRGASPEPTDWASPELLRCRGEAEARAGDRPRAGALFRQALELAARQQAAGWELRAATSLAALEPEERGRLDVVLAGFAEGAATGDLTRARALLG